MNYLNLHTDLLRSESYLGSEPVERATWINLLAWCATQENGGVIKNAADWTDRKWQQVCGITKEEAMLVSVLYHIDEGGDLIVSYYPKDKETEVRTKRETAKVNGKKGGRPKQQPTLETEEKPTLVKSPKAEGNGKEGNGKEGNGKEGENFCPQADVLNLEPEPKTPKTPKTNETGILKELWDVSPPYSRQRSSKKLVFEAWEKVKALDRPSKDDLIKAMKAWCSCDDWKKDGGQYAQGLHLWIKHHKWESLPESTAGTGGRKTAPDGPEGWREAFRAIIPTGPLPVQWSHIDEALQEEIKTRLLPTAKTSN